MLGNAYPPLNLSHRFLSPTPLAFSSLAETRPLLLILVFLCILCTPLMEELVIIMDKGGELAVRTDDNAVRARFDLQYISL